MSMSFLVHDGPHSPPQSGLAEARNLTGALLKPILVVVATSPASEATNREEGMQ
jgi:hypothetical protein